MMLQSLDSLYSAVQALEINNCKHNIMPLCFSKSRAWSSYLSRMSVQNLV